MPSRNVLKVDAADCFYHVYARGHSREVIFYDDEDYGTFLNLFKRYLSLEEQHNKIGVPYAHLYDKLELLCFCLMPNHFHLLLYQQEAGVMAKLMRGVMTSYSHYFNQKYQRSGSLFESRYKASLITRPDYYQHISRYIHLNRKDWEHTPYSSIDFYLGKRVVEWCRPQRILAMFPDRQSYRHFLADYESQKQMLDDLKHELANINDITS
jgi:putative transposase